MTRTGRRSATPLTSSGTARFSIPPVRQRRKILADGEEAWCLEPGVPLNTGTTLTTDAVRTWTALSASQQGGREAGDRALPHRLPLSGTEGEQNVAAQLLIWEFVRAHG